MDTHFKFLESAEGGTSQASEIKQGSEGTRRLESAEGRTSQGTERERVRGTHSLKYTEGWTSHDNERKKARSFTHILENAREGQVRTAKETKRATGTHFLESAGRTSQDSERM